jgi:hyperosmotically inducible protein
MRQRHPLSVMLVTVVLAAACNNTPRNDAATEPAGARESGPVDDAMVVATVQAKYYNSPNVKGRDIDVDAENGVVTLRGKVDSDSAKQEAVEIAKTTTGVMRVDDQLTVGTEADRMVARSGQPEAHSPGWITTKIQAQYYGHPRLKPWNIDVNTANGGVVTINGLVDTEADHAEALKIARATEGVTTVNDRLRVKGETAATTGTADRMAGDVTDSWITTKIQSRYFADDDVKGRNINVNTADGVVTLKGTVNSYSERLQAAAIARNTDGVREVHDELTIEPRTSDRDRNIGAGVKDSVGTAGQKIEDGWITTKIQSKYFVDDQIKSRDVNVDTKNGVVTIRGTVPSDAAKKAAETLASETDGVVRVVNQLRVDPKIA